MHKIDGPERESHTTHAACPWSAAKSASDSSEQESNPRSLQQRNHELIPECFLKYSRLGEEGMKRRVNKWKVVQRSKKSLGLPSPGVDTPQN